MIVENKVKYIHIATVLIALSFPMLPSLINLHDGYIMANTPTTICTGQNVDINFYALIFPMSILTAVAVSAWVIMFWKILKV